MSDDSVVVPEPQPSPSALGPAAAATLTGGAGDYTPWHRVLRVHWPLWLILAVYAVLACGYNVSTPLGESPDEPTHLDYVTFLRNEKRLPVMAQPGEPGLVQAGHPPLYYLVAAIATGRTTIDRAPFISNPHFTFNMERPLAPTAFVHVQEPPFPYRDAPGVRAVHVMRLVSLVAGLVTVAATYFLFLAVWPTAIALAAASAAFVAFLPGFTFFSGVFNNDTLAQAWAALAVLGAVRLAQGHASRRHMLWLGVVLGLGMLTKMTTVSLAATVGLGGLVHAYRVRRWRFVLEAAIWIGAPLLLLSGWWFVRNIRLYGDPSGWSLWTQLAPDLLRDRSLWGEIGAYFSLQTTTFWGAFGWATVRLPSAVYGFMQLLSLVALAGLAVGLVHRRNELTSNTRWGLVVVTASVVIGYISVFRLAFTFNLVVAHGRYLYFVLPGLAVLFVTGVASLVPERRRPILAAIVIGGMLALSIGSLQLLVRPAFALPQPVTFPAADPDMEPANVDFHDRVRLLGYKTSAQRIRAGEPLSITMYWQALPQNWQPFPAYGEGIVTFVHAVDAAGEVVGRVDNVPFGGRLPVLAWRPGDVWRESHEIVLDMSGTAGLGGLLVGMYVEDQPTERWDAVLDGQALGDALHIPLVIEPVVAVTVPNEARVDASPAFGDPPFARLAGASVSPAHPLPGDTLRVTLFWSADDASNLDYTAFVHLVPTDGGAPVATGDGPPQSGRYPTSLWLPSEVVDDSHEIVIPPGLEPGTYKVLVGWYVLETGERVPARTAEGIPLDDQAWLVGTVQVE